MVLLKEQMIVKCRGTPPTAVVSIQQQRPRLQEGDAGKAGVDDMNGSPSKGQRVGSRALQPLMGLAGALKPLMQGSLRRTTLLLMFIWFTNALCYYGLVLLTTSVSAYQINTL